MEDYPTALSNSHKKMKIIPTIEKYLIGIMTDEFHRFKLWDNCHQAFSGSHQTEIHSLPLAFYLASWGMYRGSSVIGGIDIDPNCKETYEKNDPSKFLNADASNKAQQLINLSFSQSIRVGIILTLLN